MQKFIIFTFSFIVVILTCLSAHANENQKIPLADQIFASDKAMEEARTESHQYSSKPLCAEPLTVRIANLKLSMPREKNASFYTDDGKIYMEMDHRCDIKSLDNVKTISTSLFYITSVHEGYKTMYDMNKSKIDQFRLSEMSKRIEGGIERMGNKEAYIYVVPQSIIKTGNATPATFYCKRHTLWSLSPAAEDFLDAGYIGMFGDCRTSYYFRSNLILNYRVFGFPAAMTGKDDHDWDPKKSAKIPTDIFIKEYAKFVESNLESYIIHP